MIGCWENTAAAKSGISLMRVRICTLADPELIAWMAFVPVVAGPPEIFAIADSPGHALEAFDSAFYSPTGQAMRLPEADDVTEVWVEVEGVRITLWRSP